MKKIFAVLFLLILALLAWLALRQLKTKPDSTVPQPALIQATNFQVSTQVSTMPRPATGTNAFVRPDSMDEETWNKWINYRHVILEQNQPVEFYARVVDQNEQPVEGARLKLKLSRIDETLFAMTNFSEWDPAKAIRDSYVDLYSDANGRIQLTQVTGMDLRVEALSKEGYSWTMPQIGSFVYEPNGGHRVGNAGMEDAFDPAKGYIFHLQKE